MSLTCDVTGSTERVEYLPLYMQTDKIKKVCFRVALKMEQERLAPKAEKPKESQKPVEQQKEASKEKVAKKKPVKKK